MDPAIVTVRDYIARHEMLEGSSGVVVAVSGGPDSMALLDILVKLADRIGNHHTRRRHRRYLKPLGSRARIHIAHLDHMLRGRGSAEDAEFVRHLAERLGLTARDAAIDVAAAARARNNGIEETARELRYRFLLKAARELGANRIAVGHTMDDQAETVLLRLARGTGTAGLAAMRPVTPAHVFDVEQQADRDDAGPRSPDQVMLIRPLLCLTRAEVENYCRENELEFRIDPTNLRDGFTRNRIRLRVMPALREINPRVSEALARAADNCAADEDALKVLAAKALDGAITTHECGIRSIYSLRSFAKQPAGLRRRMIIEAAKRLSEAGIEAAAIQALESLITAGRSGKRVELSDVCVWREFDAVVFERAVRTGHYEIRLTGTAEAGGFQFSIDRGVSSDTMSSIHEEAGRERNAGRDWMFAALDDAALPDQLSIRPRVEGERVLVLGQRGPKKLKNLMIDHRIPSSRRATWPVVATPDGEYVWSPGMPPAARFAGSANSLRLAVLRASQCIAGSKSSSAGC